jgi:choline transport protein
MSDHGSLHTADDAMLAMLGKKQVLKRRFSFFTLFGFAVCELITWETVLALFSQSFENGGPAGAVYGFIIAWSSTLSVYTVISELASMAPIAGGQYYWVYMLAPPEWKTVCSYMIGWLTSLAWIATVATETLFAGTMVQGVIALDYPDYEIERWHGTLLTWAVICGCIFVNVVIPAWLPRFEVFILVFHIAGFFAILVTLLVMTPELGSNASVWLTSLNEGGWPTQGVSYCVGFLGNVATFVGADASVHLAEEVSNAAVNIPKAIIGAMLINGTVGFAMMVTILYCLGDVDSVLNSRTDFPFIQIFFNSVGNVAGATVMAAVVLTLTWACSIGITTTASRMTWSFARDNGLPMSRYLARVSPRTKVPVTAALAVTGIAALLTLIYIGSDTAFNDVISLTITGFYGSYLMPAAFLLYHRIKGNILPRGTAIDTIPSTQAAKPTATSISPSPSAAKIHNPLSGQDIDSDDEITGVINARLMWGPFHLPRILGIVNNAYACCYMVFVIFWSVWPPSTPVTASTMNYSVVVTGGVMILSGIWYYVRAKDVYKGPLIDSEVVGVMRGGSVASHI